MTFNTIRTLFTKNNSLTKNKWVLLLLVVVIVIGVYLYSYKNKENFTGDTILFEEQTKVDSRPVVIKNEGAFADIGVTSDDGRRQSLQHAAEHLDRHHVVGGSETQREYYDKLDKARKGKIFDLVTRLDGDKLSYITNLKEHSLQLFIAHEDGDFFAKGSCVATLFDNEEDANKGLIGLEGSWDAAKTALKSMYPSLEVARPGAEHVGLPGTFTGISCPINPSTQMEEAFHSPNPLPSWTGSPGEIHCLRAGLYTEDLSFPLIQYRAVGTQQSLEGHCIDPDALFTSGCDNYNSSFACKMFGDPTCTWKSTDEKPLKDGVMTTNFRIKKNNEGKYIIPNKEDIVKWVQNLLTDKL